MIDFLLDRYLKSDAGKRRIESAIKRGGAIIAGILVQRFAARLGFDPVAFTEHFNALVGLIAAGTATVLIEFYAAYRAKLNAKTLEVALESTSGSLTPVEAKTIAKAEIKAEKQAA
jgi:hypothetical protein